MFLCVNSIGLESNECLKDGTSIHAPGMDDFIFADGGLMELATVAAPQHFFQVFFVCRRPGFPKIAKELEATWVRFSQTPLDLLDLYGFVARVELSWAVLLHDIR